ncbi:MAG: NUDIX hydrolase [Armatimonadaceae bacterium]
MEMIETVTGSERIYDGRVVNLRVDTVRLANGALSKREVIEHSGAICVVPMVDDHTVLLVRQFRLPAGKALLEIPAGGIEPGEDVEHAARRELAEEIGKTPELLIPLFQAYSAPGYSTELLYGFLALGLSDADGEKDMDEIIETETMTLEDAVAAIATGDIMDAKTICGITLALRHLGSRI